MIERRVIKLGGSLLDLVDIRQRLKTWFRNHPARYTLIVVGGGEMVEAVRELDRIHRFDAAELHWLCVDLLATTVQLAKRILVDVEIIRSAQQLDEFLQQENVLPQVRLVDVRAFYDRETTQLKLPENWETTSDSISALLAHLIAADELVLLKSRNTEQTSNDPAQWCAEDMVDRAFPCAARGLKSIRLLNLRE